MDPITNMITIIKNGYLAKKSSVSVSYSRLNEQVSKKIAAAGFLEAVAHDAKDKRLNISLGYRDSEPLLRGIKKISKPSLRVYTSAKKIPRVQGGYGEVILSTPKGILTGSEAKKTNTGGELILKIW